MATVQMVRRVTTKNVPASARNTPSLPRKPWALIAYIAGDNDLSDAGIQDLEEMSQEGTDKTAYAGVELDTIGEHDGSIRYEICEPDATGVPHRMVIQRLEERNTGDPRTLTAFLDWGLRRFAATNRVVVVWGHGTGFRTPRRDVASDESAGSVRSSLSIPDLERALHRAGVGTGRQFGKIRLLGFDACLMAMLEIAHHLRDQVEYIVGSEELEPGDGWPYNRVLAHLKGKPAPRALAQAIIKEYVKKLRKKRRDRHYSIGHRDGENASSRSGVARSRRRAVRIAGQTSAADHSRPGHDADIRPWKLRRYRRYDGPADKICQRSEGEGLCCSAQSGRACCDRSFRQRWEGYGQGTWDVRVVSIGAPGFHGEPDEISGAPHE